MNPEQARDPLWRSHSRAAGVLWRAGGCYEGAGRLVSSICAQPKLAAAAHLAMGCLTSGCDRKRASHQKYFCGNVLVGRRMLYSAVDPYTYLVTVLLVSLQLCPIQHA